MQKVSLQIQPESPHEQYGLNNLELFLTPDIQTAALDPTGDEEFSIPTPPLTEAELETNIRPESPGEDEARGRISPTVSYRGERVREEYEISYESEAVPRTPTPRTQSSSEDENKRIQGEFRCQSHTAYTTETSGTGAVPKRPRPPYFTPAEKVQPPAKYRAYPKPHEKPSEALTPW